MGAQVGGTEAGDVPVAARVGEEETVVGVEEEVEAPQGAVFGLRRCRQVGQRPLVSIGVVSRPRRPGSDC